MKFKIDRKMIDEGYISERKHPEFDLYIYNYTAKAQYDRVWNEATLNCRGLILDGEGNIVARPFPKFFNLGEYSKESALKELPPYKSFDVYDKLDGSLGILYTRPDGEVAVATRGSFESEQSIIATKLLRKKCPKLRINPDLTYLFEIIYPENRIVVNYGNKEDLILLAITQNATGYDVKRNHVESFAKTWKLNVVKKYTLLKDLDAILKLMKEDYNGKEGYVLQFNTGLRIKIKYDEYCRLHKVLTGINSKSIWEMLKEGQSLDPLLDRVPDEFHRWVKNTSEGLIKEYKKIEKKAKRVIGRTVIDLDNPTRKEIAEVFTKKSNKDMSGVLFAMYDNKDYTKIIWKMLKPSKAKAFKEEI